MFTAPSGLANTPSVAREIQDLNKKQITTPDAALQNMLTRGIDPYLAQAVVTAMRMQQAAPMQGARPPQGTVVDKTLSAAQAAPPGLAGISNPAMERANFAGGGIVAFNGEKGSDVQSNDSTWSDDEEREYRELTDVFNNPLNAPGNRPGDPDVAAKYERFKELKNRRDARAARQTTTRLFEEKPREFGPTAAVAQRTGTAGGTQAGTRTPTKTTTSTTKAAPNADAKPEDTSTTGIASTLDPNNPWASRITAARAEGLGSEQAYREAEQKRYTDLGIGQAAQKYSDVLANAMKEYEGSGASKANMKQSIIEFGANLLASKSPYFGIAAGEAAKAGITGYYGREKENKKMAFELSKATFDLNKAQEDLSLAIDQGGTAKYEKQKAKVEALENEQTKLMGELLKSKTEAGYRQDTAKYEADKRIEAAKIAAASGGVPDILMPYYRDMVKADARGDTAEADRLSKIVARGMSLTTRGYVAGEAADARTAAAEAAAAAKIGNNPTVASARRMLNTAQDAVRKDMKNPEKQQYAMRMLERYKEAMRAAGATPEQINYILGDSGASSSGGASSGATGNVPLSAADQALVDKYSGK